MEDLMRHIHKHFPLANAHMTAFFTSDHWHSLVPQQWQDELLQLTDEELASMYSLAVLFKTSLISKVACTSPILV